MSPLFEKLAQQLADVDTKFYRIADVSLKPENPDNVGSKQEGDT